MLVGAILLPVFLGVAQAAQVSVGAEGHAYNPQWSDNGEYIAFELNRYGDAVDLYVVHVSKSVPGVPSKVAIPGVSSNFSGRGTVVANPLWHPEGTVIFEGSNSGGTQRLYYWAPGGQTAAELLSSQQISGDLTFPSLSPDARTLVFVSDSAGNGDIFLWDQNSNKVSSTFTSPFTEASPRYSPDGKLIAFSRKNRGTEDLFLWSSGPSVVPFKGGNGDQSRPIWAGDQIVYFSNERGEGHWDIAIAARDGTDRRILAREIRLPMRATPALTPDGRAVIYTMSDPEQANRLMVTLLDGSRTVEIPTGLVACGEPDLVEAGGKVYVAFTALPGKDTDFRQLHILEVTGKLP